MFCFAALHLQQFKLFILSAKILFKQHKLNTSYDIDVGGMGVPHSSALQRNRHAYFKFKDFATVHDFKKFDQYEVQEN